jgi:hypothetical protein
MSANTQIRQASHLAAASQWLDAALGEEALPPLLVAIGAADGYLLDVLERRAPDTRVLVLEPNRATAKTFLARRDWTAWRQSGRLVYLIGPDYAGADQAWRVFPGAHDACKVIVHPSMAQDRDGAVRAMQLFKRIQFGVKANADARRRFAPRYLANVIRNVPAIAAGRDIRALADAYRGVPAVIAAAGPSLDAAVDDLHAVNGRALLIAVDTALRPLLHAGLSPHLVVGADPGAANARHFHALPDCSKTWLISESALDRSATSIFDGRTLWFRLARHHPWPWLQETGIDIGLMEMWGSVLTAAFQAACLAGCDPIVIVGADLAYTDGRPYCRGTTYEFDWARGTARGRTLDEVWSAQTSRAQQLRVPDVRGRETITTGALQSFRDWMVAAIKRSGRRVINAGGQGTLFGDGIEQLPLLAALPERHAIPSVDAVVHAKPPDELGDLARRLRHVHDTLTQQGAAAEPLASWAAFLEGGFKPASIAAALQKAINELEGAPGSQSSGMPWWPGHHSLARLNRLPEAIAQLNASLTAPQSTVPADAARALDRDGLLTEAFELLSRLCSSAKRLKRLPLEVRPNHIGRIPVSALFMWPDDATNWPVTLYESLLHGLRPTSQQSANTYLTRGVRLRDAAVASPENRAVPRKHDHVMHACALLAMDWLRSAGVSPREVAGVFNPLVHSITTMWSAARTNAAHEAATISITLQLTGSPHAIALTVPVVAAAFARHLTGTLTRADHVSQSLLDVRTDFFRASVTARCGTTAAGPAISNTACSRIAPRILTDEGTPGGLVSYASPEGMVCVLFQRPQSVVVLRDATVRPHHTWPRPIVGELPFGDGGAVAWGDGLSGYPDRVDAGYVMYRHERDGEVAVHDLPVRPTIGRWWHGRVYWNCHPRRIESPTGVVSWAPGEETTRSELPGLPATIGMHSDEEGLTFEVGGGPMQGGRWQRRFTREGWTWRPGGELRAIELGPFGVAAAREASGSWTAIAYPEADLVRLESSNGDAVSIACYYPVGLGWLGDSLLVGTIDQDLLLFEDLPTQLTTK